MTAGQAQIDLGGQAPAEADLRLPSPPGVIRKFWARHPLITDALLVALTLVLSLPGATLSTIEALPEAELHTWLIGGFVLSILTSVSLMWRRRFPLAVFLISFAPALLIDPLISTAVTGIAPVIAIYTVAVYRDTRTALWVLGAATASTVLAALLWTALGEATRNDGIVLVSGTVALLLIGALIGINVGNRKRYVDALIERSRQLAVERDQQARLAAAAERTRLAREMHDVVSHSLAVVVTLAEGVVATDDTVRAKQASQAIADTAREALDQMRLMLGVLRTDPDAAERSPTGDADAAGAVPFGPLLALTPVDVVGTARAAGVPVTLTVSGEAAGSDIQRLAVLRIVQEGLTNAMRYAQEPRFVTVKIDYRDGAVRVQIENDGVRAEAASKGSGVGLQGLRERVSALGGTLQAGPSAPGTWRLLAEFPLEVGND